MPKLKFLVAVVDLPYATPAGQIVSRPGYNADTCVYLDLPHDWQPRVPAAPTPDEVRNAVVVLMAPWRAYKFARSDDAAGMVSAVLAALCRPLLDLCPAYLFDASSQGAGKTRAACALGALIEGRRPAVTPFSGASTDDELRKRLVAGAVDGLRFNCLDNVVGHFKSSVVAAVLTTGRLSDRVLGASRTVDAAVRSLLTLTGNNASIDSDMQRRCVQVRIDGGVAPTHKAFDFDPISEALRLRRSIAEAACVIWRAYYAASAPDVVRGDAGGFADWNRLCRQPVLWLAREGLAGSLPWPIGDPAASMLADTSTTDPEIEALAEMLRALDELSEGSPFTAAEAAVWWAVGEHRTNTAHGQFRSAVRDLTGLREVTGRQLGNTFRNRRERVAGGRRLLAGNRTEGGWLWRVAGV
jgi:hypothetical protein